MQHHLNANIRGLLNHDNDSLGRLFNGNGEAIRAQLQERLNKREEYIPSEDCDNFCPQRGCLGHGEGTIERIWSNSSNLMKAMYRNETQKLTVFFKNGSIYEYSDVPNEVWNEFITASSGGSYLSSQIIKKYIAFKHQ